MKLIIYVFSKQKRKKVKKYVLETNFFFREDKKEYLIVEDVLKDSLKVLKDIHHPNIIELIGLIKVLKENTRYYYCIYQYSNGGNLDDYLKNKNKSLTEEEVQHIMKQLVEAVKYLNNKNIVHRDIKPKNIFIQYDSEGDLLEKNILKAKIKLSGFEYSSHIKPGKFLDTVIGTHNYMPPEIQEFRPYNEKVDIWSLGATFCKLLSCEIHFDIIKPENHTQLKYFPNLSKEANSFIQGMLREEPEKRKSADELSKHDFLIKDVKNFSFVN